MKTTTIDLECPDHRIEITEDIEIAALYIGRNKASVAPRLQIYHKLPHLKSRISIKAVVFDEANFDLEAKLIIDKGAEDTDTYLKIDALMMSDRARARAVPSLEILTDNVKGGHGATIGQVDPEQIFYLMSRGLSQHTAEETIVEAFVKG